MPQGYHEEKDPRTDKAPNHQAAASRHNISNTEIVEDWSIPTTIDELKSKTKMGDRYELYYGGTKKANAIEVVTRFNDKSVWTTPEQYLNTDEFFESRQSWNTLLTNIKNRVCRRL